MSVSVTVKSTSGRERPATGAAYDVELSVRNSRLSGCMLTSRVKAGEQVDAACTSDGSTLSISMGRPATPGASMIIRLDPQGDQTYAGTVVMRAPVLPRDVRIGSATMKPVS